VGKGEDFYCNPKEIGEGSFCSFFELLAKTEKERRESFLKLCVILCIENRERNKEEGREVVREHRRGASPYIVNWTT